MGGDRASAGLTFGFKGTLADSDKSASALLQFSPVNRD
jgi:hypothetical protein